MLTSAVRSIGIRIMGLIFLSSASGLQVGGDAMLRKIFTTELRIKVISNSTRRKD